jgi:hypothetical protein
VTAWPARAAAWPWSRASDHQSPSNRAPRIELAGTSSHPVAANPVATDVKRLRSAAASAVKPVPPSWFARRMWPTCQLILDHVHVDHRSEIAHPRSAERNRQWKRRGLARGPACSRTRRAAPAVSSLSVSSHLAAVRVRIISQRPASTT